MSLYQNPENGRFPRVGVHSIVQKDEYQSEGKDYGRKRLLREGTRKLDIEGRDLEMELGVKEVWHL